jgi:hypothetical protein
MEMTVLPQFAVATGLGLLLAAVLFALARSA